VKITNGKENSSLAPNSLIREIVISPYKTMTPHKNPKLDTKYLDQGTGFIYIGRKSDNPPQTSKLGETLACSAKSYWDKTTKINTSISDKPPKNGLWIKGQMTIEERGSRALRTLVGLGLGKTTLETKTFVYNTAKSTKVPWLELWTTGSSGREPGILFAATPSPIMLFNIVGGVGTVVTAVNHGNKGLTQDAKRTGKTISSVVFEKSNQPHLR
jgi:hypothetical protein